MFTFTKGVEICKIIEDIVLVALTNGILMIVMQKTITQTKTTIIMITIIPAIILTTKTIITIAIVTSNKTTSQTITTKQTTIAIKRNDITDAIVFFVVCLDVLEVNKKVATKATAYIFLQK